MTFGSLDKLKPMLSKLTFGSLVGYCSGYAMKRIGKAVAFGVGVIFLGLQGLVSTGYIEVDWLKIKDDAMKSADTTGDGKVDTEDLKVYWRKFWKMATHKLPDAGGFSLGFLYGVRYG
uniref:EF-hand domain-containing protein n=1 Tax=Grammatophora oceanica TaxID=210454 RepID=A0A7S1Y6P0_9STRA